MARVLPDVSGLDKEFDYLVPAALAERVEVGNLVRVELHGRRVAAWVVALDVEPPEGVELRPILKVSSIGPSPELVELSTWVAHRWAGRRSSVLTSTMGDTMVDRLPAGPGPLRLPAADPEAAAAFAEPGVTVVQVPPGDDGYRFVLAAAHFGDALVITPGIARARRLGGRLRRDGGRVALAGRDFALGAAGGVVIGARKAALARTRSLAAVVVLDEHDESLQEERNPTWHARDLAIERARRADAPVVLVSASPSMAALAIADRVVRPGRTVERNGWPMVDVIDRRQAEPSERGLFSHALVRAARDTRGRVVCILNRKGRAVMLSCGSCGELVRSADGERLMSERATDDGRRVLVGPDGEERPKICAFCGGTKLKRLRLGVERAREELEALVGESVQELTGTSADGDGPVDARVVIGTEAALHRVQQADLVAFLDIDQELLAPRYRAAEQAMALVVRAAALVGGRPGRVLVQTRTPDHRVLRAAHLADPSRFAVAERELREATGMPPTSALAELSGAGAEEMAESLQGVLGVDLLGPDDRGRYLVRAPDPATLADALATTPRPKARVRVAVDPPRV